MSDDSSQDLARIFQKAKQQEKSLFKLLDIGRTQGFQSFLNRKLIWPFLLKLKLDPLGDSGIFEWKDTMDHNSKDYEQLQKDAQRSLSSMKTFQNITKFHLKKRQEAVLSVLDTFFAKNKDLRYIQGFHDVASIFLIVYGNNVGYYMMEQAGRIYFRDFLTFQFSQIGKTLSCMVYELIIEMDKEFETIFAVYQSKFLIFILPWVLTWFSHVFSSVKIISRIWDYILCTGPHGIIYLTAAIILSTKDKLKRDLDEFDEPSIQCFYQDMVKKEEINIQQCIQLAIKMEYQIPAQKGESYQYQNLEDYKNLHPQSIFRLQIFYTKIQFHKKYHEFCKQEQKNKRLAKIGKWVALGTGLAIAVTLVGYKVYKGGDISSFFHFRKGYEL